MTDVKPYYKINEARIKRYQMGLKALKKTMQKDPYMNPDEFSRTKSMPYSTVDVLMKGGVIHFRAGIGWEWTGGEPTRNMTIAVLRRTSDVSRYDRWQRHLEAGGTIQPKIQKWMAEYDHEVLKVSLPNADGSEDDDYVDSDGVPCDEPQLEIKSEDEEGVLVPLFPRTEGSEMLIEGPDGKVHEFLVYPKGTAPRPIRKKGKAFFGLFKWVVEYEYQ